MFMCSRLWIKAVQWPHIPVYCHHAGGTHHCEEGAWIQGIARGTHQGEEGAQIQGIAGGTRQGEEGASIQVIAYPSPPFETEDDHEGAKGDKPRQEVQAASRARDRVAAGAQQLLVHPCKGFQPGHHFGPPGKRQNGARGQTVPPVCGRSSILSPREAGRHEALYKSTKMIMILPLPGALSRKYVDMGTISQLGPETGKST